MAKNSIKDTNVFPGEKLSVIEVFVNGPGAYENDGEIRSEYIGKAHFDLKNRIVEVKKNTRELVLPLEGLDVIAEVGSVMRRDARVDIFIIDGKMLSASLSGEIHITSIERNFAKDMGLAMHNGDIIKAKILNTKNRMTILSIQGADYGVVYAYCTRCGTVLELKQGKLTCSKCNRTERRKFASTYGKEEFV